MDIDPEDFYQSFKEFVEQGYRGFSQYIPMPYEVLENTHIALGDEKFHYIAANCKDLAKEKEAKEYVEHFLENYEEPEESEEEKPITDLISMEIKRYRMTTPSRMGDMHPAKPDYIVLSHGMFSKFDREMTRQIMRNPNKSGMYKVTDQRYKFHGIPILIDPAEHDKIKLI